MEHPATLGPVLRYVHVIQTCERFDVAFYFGRTDFQALADSAVLYPVAVEPEIKVLNTLLDGLSDLTVEYYLTGPLVAYHLHPCTVDNTEQYNKLLEHVDHIMKDGAK